MPTETAAEKKAREAREAKEKEEREAAAAERDAEEREVAEDYDLDPEDQDDRRLIRTIAAGNALHARRTAKAAAKTEAEKKGKKRGLFS